MYNVHGCMTYESAENKLLKCLIFRQVIIFYYSIEEKTEELVALQSISKHPSSFLQTSKSSKNKTNEKSYLLTFVELYKIILIV